MNLREFIQSEIKSQISESVNEAKTYKKGDKLKIKLKNGKKFDVVFDSYSRTKGVALGKFKDRSGEYDTKPFNLDTIVESVNEGFKSEYEGNDGIVWKKGKTRGDVTNFTPYYKGHDIDKGGYNFKTEKELKDFIKDYILSNQLYNKYRFESVNEEKEVRLNELSTGTYRAAMQAGLDRNDSKGDKIAKDALNNFGRALAKNLQSQKWEVKSARNPGALYYSAGLSGDAPKHGQYEIEFTGKGRFLSVSPREVIGSNDVSWLMEVIVRPGDSMGSGSEFKFTGYRDFGNKAIANVQLSIRGGSVEVYTRGSDRAILEFTRRGARKLANVAQLISLELEMPDKIKHNSIKQFNPLTVSESVNEKYTGNPGDKLVHKHYKNIEIELIEPTNKGWKVYQSVDGKKPKIKYFHKQDIVGNKALFESEHLDEKLITFSNRSPYGQIVFMAGGAASGKGYAIDNFIDAAGFKVRDVDEMKKAVGKLDQLGKFSVDKWYKKYGNKLKPKDKAHIEEFVLGKGMAIADVAADLKNPNNVMSLHLIVDAMGLKDKWLINMLKGKQNKETLPNLLFDITAKKVGSITSVIKPLVDAGYDSKNIHLIWVLTNYHLAVKQNKERSRVVPDDILLLTHEGAAKTIWSILTSGLPKGLDGRIDVILNNRENTLYWVKPSIRKSDDDGKKFGMSKSLKGDNVKVGVVAGFKSLPIKKQGGGITPEKEWKKQLYGWVLDNGPKTVDLRKPLDTQLEGRDG